MCYFAINDFECGDWKWGNMKERCPRQHRIGETCGAKLIHQDHITKTSGICKVCQDIEVKRRRLAKVEDSITRWTPERERFAASLEKAIAERDELIEKIKSLHLKRQSVQFRTGTGGSGGPSSLMANRGHSASSQMSSGYVSTNVSPFGAASEQYTPSSNRPTPYSSRR